MTNKDFFIATWQRDAGITAKAFRSMPNDLQKLSKQHHPNFRSPWSIINHVGPHGKELCQAITEGRMNLINEGNFPLEGPTIYKSPEDAAKDVETNSTRLAELAKNCSETDWTTKVIPVYWGQMKVFEMPLMELCWT